MEQRCSLCFEFSNALRRGHPEGHHLGAALFAKVGELLMANGMRLSGRTIVDATLIAAPPAPWKRQKETEFSD